MGLSDMLWLSGLLFVFPGLFSGLFSFMSYDFDYKGVNHFLRRKLVWSGQAKLGRQVDSIVSKVRNGQVALESITYDSLKYLLIAAENSYKSVSRIVGCLEDAVALEEKAFTQPRIKFVKEVFVLLDYAAKLNAAEAASDHNSVTQKAWRQEQSEVYRDAQNLVSVAEENVKKTLKSITGRKSKMIEGV